MWVLGLISGTTQSGDGKVPSLLNVTGPAGLLAESWRGQPTVTPTLPHGKYLATAGGRGEGHIPYSAQTRSPEQPLKRSTWPENLSHKHQGRF